MSFPLALLSTSAVSPVADERASRVRDALASLPAGSMGFEGLRRLLGWHPQALVRVLRRLESEGVVHRSESGYGLVNPPTSRVGLGPPESGAWRPFFVAALPPHADASAVEARLSQRWFEGLRWLGRETDGAETRLHWVLDGGAGRVRLRVTDRVVGLEASGAPEAGPAVLGSAAGILRALALVYRDASRRAGPGAGLPELPRSAG